MTRDDGLRRAAEVRAKLAEFVAGPPRPSDEDLVSLRQRARSALDRLDDEPEFEDAHRLLDEVGAFVRSERSELCVLESDGDDFQQTCPVALGHVRLGLSVEARIEESRCSICHEDPWFCPHIPGKEYDGVRAAREIVKADFLGVAVVSRPDMPDARFMSHPVSRMEVESALGRPLPQGARPICDRCLSVCSGIRDASL
jgi:hypothetical protein